VTATIAANAPVAETLTLVEPRGQLAWSGDAIGVAVTRRFAAGQMTLLGETMAPAADSEFGDTVRHSVAMQYRRDFASASGRMRIGTSHESGALLGLDWVPGAGTSPHAASSFVGLGARWNPFAGLSIAAEGELGFAAPRLTGWIQVAKPLLTTAFTADVSLAATPRALRRRDRQAIGRWFLTMRQPLRIERGALAITLPAANAYGRSSLDQVTRVLDATPSGRELEFGAGYELRLAHGLLARAELSWTRDPGHIATGQPERAAALSFRIPFD
jgi:hypothetical protein